jgi:hypothetical protein
MSIARSPTTDGLPQVWAGMVRGLAVTSHQRSPYVPELPTVDETVLPGFVVETWNGIMAPGEDCRADPAPAVGDSDQDGGRPGGEGGDAPRRRR